MSLVKPRPYKLLSDFKKVHTFLQEQYSIEDHNGYFLPQFFEYAQTHPAFDYSHAHRIGIWEKDEKILGIASYEMQLGEAFFVARKGHEELYPEMLEYAKQELAKMKDSTKVLYLWTSDGQKAVIDMMAEGGYEKFETEAISIYDYSRGLSVSEAPEGYRIVSLEEENDILKIHHCLWKGFDHGDEPDGDFECRRQMQSGPNFRRDLSMLAIAEDGSYACFAGMWYDERNHYAYLEPLATVPEHRRKGLGKALVFNSMKKTLALGAQYCYGGSLDYYTNMGFRHAGTRYAYKIL